MPIVFKISKPFHDILTADDKNLVVSSELNNPKIFMDAEFSATLPANEQTATVTIATHNLGYKPRFWVFCETGDWDTGAPRTDQREAYAGGSGGVSWATYATNTTIALFLITATIGYVSESDRTYGGHYYIFNDPST